MIQFGIGRFAQAAAGLDDPGWPENPLLACERAGTIRRGRGTTDVYRGTAEQLRAVVRTLRSSPAWYGLVDDPRKSAAVALAAKAIERAIDRNR